MGRSAMFMLFVLLTTPQALAAASGPLEPLGNRQFECKHGELRLEGDKGGVRYAPGSHETVRVPTRLGILRFTCRFVRSIVTCPLDTTVVAVRRGVYQNRFDVTCLGEFRGAGLGIPGPMDSGDEPAVEAAPE